MVVKIGRFIRIRFYLRVRRPKPQDCWLCAESRYHGDDPHETYTERAARERVA